MDLELDIARETAAPAQARAAVRSFAGAALDDEVLADAILLVSELVSNAVKYGKGAIRLRVRTRGTHQVLVEVIDEGDGFVPGVRRTSRFPSGGFGLKLVEQIATDWGVHSRQTHVWFVIDRSAELAAVA
jgi:signal transduction histidine kinase